MSVLSSCSPVREVRELVEQAVDLGSVGLGRAARRRVALRTRLERRPHLREAAEILDLDARDEHPATRVHVDEPLVGEALECLTNRRPAGRETLHQRPLTDDRARLELERDDQLTDRKVRALALRPRVGGLRLVDDKSGRRHQVTWGRGRLPRPHAPTT